MLKAPLPAVVPPAVPLPLRREGLGAAVVAEAMRWIDTPFEPQQACRGAGCDCKGLIVGVARELDLPAARSSFAAIADYQLVDSALLVRGLEETMDRVARREPGQFLADADALPGDLLLIDLKDQWGRMKPQHMAIYARENRMIHTLFYAGLQKVRCDRIGSAWWRRVDSIWRWRAASPLPRAGEGEAAKGAF